MQDCFFNKMEQADITRIETNCGDFLFPYFWGETKWNLPFSYRISPLASKGIVRVFCQNAI